MGNEVDIIIKGTGSRILLSYTIVYSDSNGSCLGSVDVLASSFVGKNCIYVLDTTNESCVLNSSQITLTSFATNFFGKGLQSEPKFVGGYYYYM